MQMSIHVYYIASILQQYQTHTILKSLNHVDSIHI